MLRGLVYRLIESLASVGRVPTSTGKPGKPGKSQKKVPCTGLEKSTRPLVFTSASGCRASGILDDFQCKLIFYPSMSIIFVMQGKCLF